MIIGPALTNILSPLLSPSRNPTLKLRSMRMVINNEVREQIPNAKMISLSAAKTSLRGPGFHTTTESWRLDFHSFIHSYTNKD